jgi:hypothetical protein
MAKTTKIDEVTFAGRSGTRYDFRIYVWETKFKAVPGVYVVASRTMEPAMRAVHHCSWARRPIAVALKSPSRRVFQMYYGACSQRAEGMTMPDASFSGLLDGLAPPCNAADAA